MFDPLYSVIVSPALIITLMYLYKKKIFMTKEKVYLYAVKLFTSTLFLYVISHLVRNTLVKVIVMFSGYQLIGTILGIVIWFFITKPPRKRIKKLV